MTKGAVSYQIRRLEQHLDCQLFKRNVRQVYLTDSGQKLYQATGQIFNEFKKAIDLAKPASRYDISIAATTYVAARWLSPRVAKFLEHHPDIAIQFEHGINADGFVLDDVDVAILWGRCGESHTKHQLRQLPMPLFPACSPELSAKLSDKPETLHDTMLLYENRSQDLWQEWFGEHAITNPKQIIEDANVRVQAAIDGQGMILADGMMQNELGNGNLVVPFSKQLKGYGYILMSSTHRHINSEANEMIKWLTTH